MTPPTTSRSPCGAERNSPRDGQTDQGGAERLEGFGLEVHGGAGEEAGRRRGPAAGRRAPRRPPQTGSLQRQAARSLPQEAAGGTSPTGILLFIHLLLFQFVKRTLLSL